MVLGIIIFQGLIFLALIFIMRQFMKGHVSGAVGHLHKLNEELAKQQAELKQKNAEVQKEYETRMNSLEQELSAKQAEARTEAVKLLEESRARALTDREKIINEAVETREKMRQEIMAEMEEKAILHSRELISQFFSGELKEMIHEVLVREVFEGLAELDVTQFQFQTDSVQFKAAQPLSAELKAKLQKILKDKMKKEITLKEEVDPSLVAGLTLVFGTLVIDGSLNNRLREAAARLKKETARRYQGST